MKLQSIRNILEALHNRGIVTLYKGLNEENFEKFKKHHIPGFMAEYKLAMIYAQPSLTGSPADTRILISTSIDTSDIPDYTDIVKDMCYNWANEHPELRSKIWTAWGSAHGDMDAVYIGEPVKYKVEATFHGDDEWMAAFNLIRQ